MPRKEKYKTRDQLIQENKKLLEQIALMQTKPKEPRRLHFKLGTDKPNEQ